MNIKALGLSALMALAAPLSAQAVTAINAGDTIDILADDVFLFDTVGQGLSGLTDIVFEVQNNSADAVNALAFQLTFISNSVDLPQMNWAANDMVYVDGVGFGPGAIAVATLDVFDAGAIVTVTGSIRTNLAAFSSQFLNIGFGSGTGEIFAGSFTISAVPLPASALLFMTALGGLGFLSRRKAA